MYCCVRGIDFASFYHFFHWILEVWYCCSFHCCISNYFSNILKNKLQRDYNYDNTIMLHISSEFLVEVIIIKRVIRVLVTKISTSETCFIAINIRSFCCMEYNFQKSNKRNHSGLLILMFFSVSIRTLIISYFNKKTPKQTHLIYIIFRKIIKETIFDSL